MMLEMKGAAVLLSQPTAVATNAGDVLAMVGMYLRTEDGDTAEITIRASKVPAALAERLVEGAVFDVRLVEVTDD